MNQRNSASVSGHKHQGPSTRLSFRIQLILFCVLCLLPLQVQANGGPNILVLHSYHQGYRWTDDMQKGMADTFASSIPAAELYVEYMNTKRKPREVMFPQLFQLYSQAYAKVRFDAILASDNNALDFLLRYRDTLFTGVPVIFCGINDIHNYHFKPEQGFTGVAENADIVATIALILKLHPDTRKLAIISDSTETGDLSLANIRKAAKNFPQLSLIELSHLNRSQLVTALRQLGNDTAVFNSSFTRAEDGHYFSASESTQFIVEASSRPVFTSWDFTLAHGTVGGKILSGYQQGQKAAALAVRVLGGEKAGTIPVADSPTTYMFEYQGLKKHNISEAELPHGSIVLNRPDSFYSRYYRYVWFGLGLFSLQLLIIHILARNIARRKREEQARITAEESLRESEARYRGIIESVKDTIYRTDLNGLVTLINPAGVAMLGYDSAADIIGKPNASFWQEPEKRQTVLELMKQNGMVQDYEVVLLRRDGSPVTVSATSGYYYDKQGQVLGVEGILRDISERKKAEEELSRQKNLISNIIESSSQAIFAKDLQGRYVSINKAGADMLGYSVSDIIGHTDAELLPAEAALEFRKSDEIIIKEGRGQEREEIFLVDGKNRFFLTNKTPWRDNDGDIIGLVGVSKDITEHKEHEQEQLKLDKLESLGVLAGGIAHDFNNILTGIIGNISLAQIYLEPGHRSRKPLSEAEKASVRASELAHQLLTFARGGKPLKKTIALPPLLKETCSLVLHGSNCRCNLNIADNISNIEADEGQLSQVFHNLIINASQAMPGGGSIDISAHNLQLENENMPELPAGNYISITVSDQGCGIAPENLAKIFDPYFTTKATGNGLGLASAHSIIVHHGGHISVSSAPGVGTTFTILLPAGTTDPQSSAGSTSPQPGNHHRGGNILIMDDETMILQLLSGMLEHFGYRPVCAENSSETVRLYREALNKGERFTAVIMDLTIPGGKGGKETAAEILAMDPAACLIVSSGYSNDPVMADYRNYGFRGTLAKPYKIAEIDQLLGELLK